MPMRTAIRKVPNVQLNSVPICGHALVGPTFRMELGRSDKVGRNSLQVKRTLSSSCCGSLEILPSAFSLREGLFHKTPK